jgi:hypothetical protein
MKENKKVKEILVFLISYVGSTEKYGGYEQYGHSSLAPSWFSLSFE